MPNLVALLNPIGSYPAFLVPLFMDRDRQNRLLIQEISIDDVVLKFVVFEIDAESGIMYPNHLSITAEVGDSAQWAFGFSDVEYVVGDATEVGRAVGVRLQEGEFSRLPMLEAMAAQFCGKRKIYLRALKSGYKMLERQSELSAAIWRDTVILQPLVRAALVRSLQIAPDFASNVEEVCVHVDRHAVLLEVPKGWSAGSQLTLDFDREHIFSHKNFNEVREVASVFGISEFRVTEHSVPRRLFPKMGKYAVPSALVFALSSTGAAVTGQGPSGLLRNPVEMLPKSVRRQSDHIDSQPSCIFVILDMRRDQVENGISVARRWRRKQLLKIAIVRSPIGFGPRRPSTLSIEEAMILKDHFEYVFVIGNHVLQKHVGFAPSLSALGKGTSYARLCVDSILELLLWLRSTTGSQNLESILPRGGLCLVGRGEFDPEDDWVGGKHPVSTAVHVGLADWPAERRCSIGSRVARRQVRSVL